MKRRGRALKRRYGRSVAKGYSAPTRRLIERYRELVSQQRAMPSSEQWTMGPILREARAKALVAIGDESFGPRRH